MEILDPCPVEVVVKIFSDKWKIIIYRNLIFKDHQRFTELEKGINGISQKMLTQQLKQLEKDGILVRTVYPEVPVKVVYSLSTFGQSFKPIFESMYDWGVAYLEAGMGPV